MRLIYVINCRLYSLYICFQFSIKTEVVLKEEEEEEAVKKNMFPDIAPVLRSWIEHYKNNMNYLGLLLMHLMCQ